VKQTEDIVKMGDEIWVKCLGVDEKGRVKLSRKAAMADRDKEMGGTGEGEQPPPGYNEGGDDGGESRGGGDRERPERRERRGGDRGGSGGGGRERQENRH
jgi:polyribonucleotide nucleotidyltransferase